MRAFLTLLIAFPSIVVACEGECIVGITKAFLGNYSRPVHATLQQLNNEMFTSIHPDRRYSSPPFLMEPILSAYKKNAYNVLENAIFPSYFHGKCQQPNPADPDGPWVNPEGCPNPDCAVVCGTPGSMVHYYPRLRYIAYNCTRHDLQTHATPGSQAYEEAERNFLREAMGGGAYERRWKEFAKGGPTMMPRIRRQEQGVKDRFREVMRRLSPTMEKVCGGTGSGQLRGLQKCSWETRMKDYILTFP